MRAGALDSWTIDKQVLTQLECGVSTFPWKHNTQVFIWSFYASNALVVAFQNALCACSSTWFFPPPVFYLVSEHSQNSQTALELSTEQGRSAWLPRAGAVWMWRQHGRGTHPELSFQKYSFGQTAYSLIL